MMRGFVRFMPVGLKDWVKRHRRRARLRNIRRDVQSFEVDDFLAALDELGVHSGDTLFVHSSGDFLKYMNGGLGTVINHLMERIGPEGTLLMPAFPIEGMAVDELKKGEFDIRRTPSRMGLLTEIFRRKCRTVRSLHPTHSVCAIGPNADYLTRDHHRSEWVFGSTSPFRRLEEFDGKILLIGVGVEVLTHVHVVEDAMKESFPVNIWLDRLFEVTVNDAEGQTAVVKTRCHNPIISRRKSIKAFEPEWIHEGVAVTARLAGSTLMVLNSGRVTENLRQNAKSGRTIYGK